MSIRDDDYHMGGIGYGPRSARLDHRIDHCVVEPGARLAPT